jgi:starch synthase
MKVLFATSELFPWIKTGGLGDVAAALPPALVRQGINVRLVLPGFPRLLDGLDIREVVRIGSPFAVERVRIGLASLPGSGVPAYIVDHAPFYDRSGGPYAGPDGRDWPDNHLRFALFSWAAAALAGGADPAWSPDIVHGHDWHAGLVPAYLRASGTKVPSIFTVHNLAYQGLFPGAAFEHLHLPPEFFSIDGAEFYGGVSFMKAGLYYADRLTTVSPTYAREVQTPAFGEGLDGLLRSRSQVLSGILNGVDPGVWSPKTDAILPRPYNASTARAGKAAAKAELQQRLGLQANDAAPLFGVVSRLTPQKGLDLLLSSLPELTAAGGHLALLGAGDRGLEQGFLAASSAYPGKIGVEIGYDESLSHLLIAGSDVTVVSSRFEPCGLVQLYALGYGSLPLVSRTGGLADTVVDVTPETLSDGTATGFVFTSGDPQNLLEAMKRAIASYQDVRMWQQLVRQAMTRDFSWDLAAGGYIELYRTLAPDRPLAAPAAPDSEFSPFETLRLTPSNGRIGGISAQSRRTAR